MHPRIIHQGVTISGKVLPVEKTESNLEELATPSSPAGRLLTLNLSQERDPPHYYPPEEQLEVGEEVLQTDNLP